MTLVGAVLGSISSTKRTGDSLVQRHDARWVQLRELYILCVARGEQVEAEHARWGQEG
jgi:hypothetical protein